MLYTTAKPTDHLAGYISALGGNFGAQKVEGAISGPLAGDLLQGRLSVYYQKRDGFQRNLFTNRTNGDVFYIYFICNNQKKFLGELGIWDRKRCEWLTHLDARFLSRLKRLRDEVSRHLHRSN